MADYSGRTPTNLTNVCVLIEETYSILRAFLVEALKDVTPPRINNFVHTLWSLDTQAIANVLDQVNDLSTAVFMGISQSGTTMETLSLMNTIRDAFDHAGLDPCNHFVWITESKDSLDAQVPNGIEAFDGSLKRHKWNEANAIQLTFSKHGDINALFSVPHSVPFFLTLALLFDNQVEEVGKIYEEYLSLRKGLDHISLLETAESLAAMYNPEIIQVDIEECISPAANDLITQLIAQALGSKQDNFNPRVHIGKLTETTKHKPGALHFALPMPGKASNYVKLMLSIDSVAYFVAMVAYHKEINFVTHPKVNIYKKRAIELLASAKEEQAIHNSMLPFNPEDVVAYLQSNPSHPLRRRDLLWPKSCHHLNGRDTRISNKLSPRKRALQRHTNYYLPCRPGGYTQDIRQLYK